MDGNGLAISVLDGKVVALKHQLPGIFGFGGSQDCWYWFPPGTAAPAGAKYADLASPSTGIPGGEALTAMWAPTPHGPTWIVGLASASKGNTAQQWTYNGNSWTNGAVSLELRTNGNGGPVTLTNPANAGAPETFTFATP